MVAMNSFPELSPSPLPSTSGAGSVSVSGVRAAVVVPTTVVTWRVVVVAVVVFVAVVVAVAVVVVVLVVVVVVVVVVVAVVAVVVVLVRVVAARKILPKHGRARVHSEGIEKTGYPCRPCPEVHDMNFIGHPVVLSRLFRIGTPLSQSEGDANIGSPLPPHPVKRGPVGLLEESSLFSIGIASLLQMPLDCQMGHPPVEWHRSKYVRWVVVAVVAVVVVLVHSHSNVLPSAHCARGAHGDRRARAKPQRARSRGDRGAMPVCTL